MMNLEPLYQQAITHRNTHDCSAYPYEQGSKLITAIEEHKPQVILEIGTGMGYTATIMAKAAPKSHITTIEKDLEHIEVARLFFEENGVANQITLVNESAEAFLGTLNQKFDFIFFDGYQIHYEFLPHYERLLKSGGILFLGNNHLKSRTSEQFFTGLNDVSKWKIQEQFAETTVSEKL